MNFNKSVAQKYATTFASKICDDFFQNHATISGEQILKLTKLKQINVFIVAAIYKNWKTETEQFRSPYFDYTNPQVNLALQSFMNTVSKNITVKKVDFEPIVRDSVFQTLELLLSPKNYFESFIKENDNKFFTIEQSNILEKYTKIHQNIVEKIINKYTELIEIDTNTLVSFVAKMDDSSFESPNQYLEEMSIVVPVKRTDFFESTESEQVENEKNAIEHLSATDNTENVPTMDSIEPIIEQQVSLPVIDTVNQTIIHADVVEDVAVPTTLNQQFVEVKTVKELLEKETENVFSVHHLNTNNKVDSISASISLNKKFIFIGRLFGGDINAYNKSLEELDNFTNFLDARNYINKSLSPNYNWMMATEEAEEFLELVANRFK